MGRDGSGSRRKMLLRIEVSIICTLQSSLSERERGEAEPRLLGDIREGTLSYGYQGISERERGEAEPRLPGDIREGERGG